MEVSEVLMAEEYKFAYSVKLMKRGVFEIFWAVKPLIRGTPNNNSPVENLSTTENFWKRTLKEEVKLVVFGIWIPRKIKSELVSMDISHYQDSARRDNKRFFVWIIVQKFWVFDWDLDGGNITCISCEIKVWTSNEFKINSTFWNIWTVTNLMHASKQNVR